MCRYQIYLLGYPRCVEIGAEDDDHEMRGVVVGVVSTVVGEGVVNLEPELAAGRVKHDAPHIPKEHLHRDLIEQQVDHGMNL